MTTKPNFPAPLKPTVSYTLPRFAGLRAIFALMLREMSTSYGRSPGGYIWAILEPIAGIAMLSAIFSIGFRSPALGTVFALFYATGMLPYLLFMDLAGKLGQALNYSKQLLAYPRVTFVDAILARFFINLMTQLLISYLVIFGILLIFPARMTLDLTIVARGYALAAFLAIGIGTFNCYMIQRFPIYQRVWSILTRPLFLLSCIFFLFDTVPKPYQDWLWYNPLIHIVGLVRRGFYGNYDAPYVSELYVISVSFIALVFGLLLLRRDHKSALER